MYFNNYIFIYWGIKINYVINQLINSWIFIHDMIFAELGAAGMQKERQSGHWIWAQSSYDSKPIISKMELISHKKHDNILFECYLIIRKFKIN